MRILPLHPEIIGYLHVHRLTKKFLKQTELLIQNIRHPGLHWELLEPKHMRLYSFRVDQKYRAIFIFRDKNTIEILDVNNHYK